MPPSPSPPPPPGISIGTATGNAVDRSTGTGDARFGRAADRELRGVRRAAALSLFLHALAVAALALWQGIKPVPAPPQPELVRLTLAPRALPAPEPEPEPEPETAAPADPEPAVEEPDRPVPVEDPDRVRDAPLPDPPVESIASEEEPAESVIDLDRLRRQLTDRAFSDEPQHEAGPPGSAAPERALPWTERGEAIRGLPLGGGWLNPYVGPVQTRSETWTSQSGEDRGYHVLANGQAVCTRTPAPSFSELIHPWKAMRVTLAWDCGRVRGSAPPPDDLDYAPAPAALRNSTQAGSGHDRSSNRTTPEGTAVP